MGGGGGQRVQHLMAGSGQQQRPALLQDKGNECKGGGERGEGGMACTADN
jgi:hypothetical protein